MTKTKEKVFLWHQWHKRMIELVMVPQSDMTTTRGISTDTTKAWRHIKVKHGLYFTSDEDEIKFLEGHVNYCSSRDSMHNRGFRELDETEMKKVREFQEMKIPHNKMANQLDLEMKTLRQRKKLTVA